MNHLGTVCIIWIQQFSFQGIQKDRLHCLYTDSYHVIGTSAKKMLQADRNVL